jgi:hypothetical protein
VNARFVPALTLVAALAAGGAPTMAEVGGRGRPADEVVPAREGRTSGAFVGGRIGYLEVEGVDDGSLNVGILAGYRWASAIGVEASVDYHTADFDAYGRSTYAFQASVVLHPFPPRAPIQPYVLGGVGYYVSEYDLEFDHDGGFALDDDAGYHAGFGADVVLSRDPHTGERFQATVDVRYLFTREDEPWERRRRDGLLITVGGKIRF